MSYRLFLYYLPFYFSTISYAFFNLNIFHNFTRACRWWRFFFWETISRQYCFWIYIIDTRNSVDTILFFQIRTQRAADENRSKLAHVLPTPDNFSRRRSCHLVYIVISIYTTCNVFNGRHCIEFWFWFVR